MGLDGCGQGCGRAAEVGRVAGLDEAEVALGEGEGRVGGEVAEDGQARGLGYRVPRRPVVSLARDAIEDHGGQPDVAAVGGEAQGHRAGALGRGGGVDEEDDGRRGEDGEVGRRGAKGGAVVEAHDSLDDGQRVARSVARKTGEDGPASHEADVEVARGPPEDGGVELRVDVVGPGLEGADPEAAGAEGAKEAEGEARLARARGGGGDDDASRVGQRSTPSRAWTPAS